MLESGLISSCVAFFSPLWRPDSLEQPSVCFWNTGWTEERCLRESSRFSSRADSASTNTWERCMLGVLLAETHERDACWELWWQKHMREPHAGRSHLFSLFSQVTLLASRTREALGDKEQTQHIYWHNCDKIILKSTNTTTITTFHWSELRYKSGHVK